METVGIASTLPAAPAPLVERDRACDGDVEGFRRGCERNGRALVEAAGFRVERVYGWFDYRPYRGGEDIVFVCRAG